MQVRTEIEHSMVGVVVGGLDIRDIRMVDDLPFVGGDIQTVPFGREHQQVVGQGLDMAYHGEVLKVQRNRCIVIYRGIEEVHAVEIGACPQVSASVRFEPPYGLTGHEQTVVGFVPIYRGQTLQAHISTYPQTIVSVLIDGTNEVGNQSVFGSQLLYPACLEVV